MESRNPETNLPPGFRFHPTDEELIIHYLKKKVISIPIPLSTIADVDIYKFDPWDLPAKAPFSEKEWYFFSPRDRKYPNGARPNRTAGSGYWKATGTDKIITTTVEEVLQENIGVKKSLVFYKGRPPKGIKTNWIMHEYRLTDSKVSNPTNDRGMRLKRSSYMRLDDWVLCRIYNKAQPSSSSPSRNQEQEEQEGFMIPETQLQTLKPQKSYSFSNLLDAADFSILSSFLSETPSNQTAFEFPSNSVQTFLNNLGNICSGGDYDYLDQKLPDLIPYSPAKTENHLIKRRRLDLDENSVNPFQKIMVFCGYNNSVDLPDDANGNHQCNFKGKSEEV